MKKPITIQCFLWIYCNKPEKWYFPIALQGIFCSHFHSLTFYLYIFFRCLLFLWKSEDTRRWMNIVLVMKDKRNRLKSAKISWLSMVKLTDIYTVFSGILVDTFFFQPMDTDIFYRYDLKKFNVFKQNYEKSEISF